MTRHTAANHHSVPRRPARGVLPTRLALVLMVIGLVSGTLPAGADVITLHNGDELFGRALSVSSDSVGFETDGQQKTWPASAVLKLEFDHVYEVAGEKTVAQIADPVIKEALANMPTEKEYPEASLVTLLDEDRYDVEADGTYTRTVRQIFVVLKEKARETANTAFSYFPDLESYEILHGRSITPGTGGLLGLVGGNPGSVRYLTDRTVADETDFAVVPLYQRRKTVKFAIPEVNPGTIVDRQFRIKRTKVDPLRPFLAEKLFRSSEPARLVRLVVNAPQQVPVTYAVDEHGTTLTVELAPLGNRREYRITASNTAPILFEPHLPPLARMAPRAVVGLGGTWESVVGSFRKVIDQTVGAAEKDPRVEAFLVDTLGGEKDPLAAQRKIFVRLGREITQTGIDPVEYSWQPHEPGRILEQKQAGALDLAVLYHVLLKKAGVANDLYLFRPEGAGTLDPGVPNLMQMKGLGVRVAGAAGATRFNLPLSDAWPFDLLPTFLQGASCIALDSGLPFTIPPTPPAREGEAARIEGTLKPDGTLVLRQTIRPCGQNEAAWRGFKNLKREDQRVALEQAIHAQFAGATLTGFTFTGMEDVTVPLEIALEAEIPEFALRSGDDCLVFRMPLTKEEYTAAAVGSPRRFSPMAWATQLQETKQIRITFPEAYRLYALPEGTWAFADGFFHHSSFSGQQGSVSCTDVLIRARDWLDAEAYASYKKFVEDRSQITDRWVVIRK